MSVVLEGGKFHPVRRTIKRNNIFLVTDEEGNVLGNNISGYGLYLGDTRFLSKFELSINDTHPIILISSTESGHSSIVIGTNLKVPDNASPDRFIPQETVQIKREAVICGAYFETITLANYNLVEAGIKLELSFEADFMDIFEVRNLEYVSAKNPQRAFIKANSLVFKYEDVTGAIQEVEIIFNGDIPLNIEENKVIYELIVPPAAKIELKFQINLKSTAMLHTKIIASDFAEAFLINTEETRQWNEGTTSFVSDNEEFQEMIFRSRRDIHMLKTKAVYGEYISAGIPWFTTLFGRDSIIAARQALLLCPDIAKQVLNTLVLFQGKEENAWKDEEPGKILHEIRFGELARSNQIPHTPYYGSVDSTPLWLILLYEYIKWTDDRDTLEKLWSNALACLDWMDNYGVNNGFAYYCQKSHGGLRNQAWKDSWDSYMHADGTLAEAPINPVEAQGYFYSAKIKMARLAGYLKDYVLAGRLLSEAEDLKQRFHNAFWVEEMGYYALGLDRDGQQLKVVSSNPGHLLETGILEEEYARKVASRLFERDMFSGWGIRTLSYDCVSYNPMSYHNGSIWPHDNSIIAIGLTRAEMPPELVQKIASSMFEAARRIYYKRLPELFCGFTRQYHRQDPPVSYPVACAPQAWATASVFQLIQAMLNIEPDAQERKLRITNPLLPDWLDMLELRDIRVGEGCVNIEFRKTGKGLVIDVFDKRGKLDVIIRK